MALLLIGKSLCPICEQVIAAADEVILTPAFLADASHPLWPFNDSAMHSFCFSSWPLRASFITEHNDFFVKHYRGARFMDINGLVREADPQ